jgi:hypothetical protein
MFKDLRENNILIAEFMGFTINDDICIIPTESGDKERSIDSLTFRYSWDALMPVVEKIEELEMELLPSYSTNNFCVSIRNGFCQIISGDFMEEHDEFNIHSGGKLEATYSAIIEFIKWYNENK